MSTTLYWRPHKQKDHVLPRKLIRVCFTGDPNKPVKKTLFTRKDIPLLSGALYAGTPGALTLIHALQDHGRVDVWVE